LSNYELTYILRPLEEANLSATNEKINTIVQNAGGEIVARNDWGRRRLAYPIRKIPDGYYSTLFVTLPGTAVRGVERALQLNDDVLRYLVVRVEEFRLPTQPAAEVPVPAAQVPGTTPPSATSAAPPPATPPPAEPAAEPAAEPTSETAPAASTEGS
jgi:small subunit ribosomal protein S6